MKKLILLLTIIILQSPIISKQSSIINAQNWTTTSSSSGTRTHHTTTVLNDGRLIIIGGNLVGITPVVEIFDPTNNTWTIVADLPVPVAGHATVCTSDSTVFVFGGGTSAASVDNVWEYNLNTDEWTQKEDMHIDIVQHTATLLPNNKVLILGGYRQPTDTDNPFSFEYDPATNTYSPPSALLSTKDGHTSIVLNNGKVMVVGGYNYDVGMITDVEYYDPVDKSWTKKGEISIGRSGGQEVIKSPSGDVFIIGGYNFAAFQTISVIDKYDASTETWTTIKKLPEPMTGLNAAMLESGEILIAGGQGGNKSGGKGTYNENLSKRDNYRGKSQTKSTSYITDVFSINTETGIQTTLNSLSVAHAHGYARSLPDNRVIVLYGRDTSYFNYGEIYGTPTAPLKYDVTFHVYESNGSTPASGTSIDFNSETLITNDSGEVTFSDVEKSSGIPFTATKIGFENYSGAANVTLNDINLNITLQTENGVRSNIINENLFSVYPNPSNGEFTIEIGSFSGSVVERSRNAETTIIIYDITGRIVWTVRAKNLSPQLSIDLSAQNKGIYFIKTETENAVYTKKIIIN